MLSVIFINSKFSVLYTINFSPFLLQLCNKPEKWTIFIHESNNICNKTLVTISATFDYMMILYETSLKIQCKEVDNCEI